MAKKPFPPKKGAKGKGKAPPFKKKPAEGSAAEEATESPAFEAQEDAGNSDAERTKYAKGGMVR